MSTPHLSVRARLAAAVKSPLASLIHRGRASLYRPVSRWPGTPRFEELESRVLLQATGYQYPWCHLGYHPSRYCTCDCCDNTEVAQNDPNGGGGFPGPEPTSLGGSMVTGGAAGAAAGRRGGGDVSLAYNPKQIQADWQQYMKDVQQYMEQEDLGDALAAGGEIVLPPPSAFGFTDLPDPPKTATPTPVTDSPAETGFSSDPVRFTDGQPKFDITDLSSGGYGKVWSQTRSYDPNLQNAGPMGNHWMINQMPHLSDEGSAGDPGRPAGATDTMVVVTSGSDYRYFDLIGSNWVERYGGADVLGSGTATVDGRTGVNIRTLTDTTGGVTTFVDTTDGTQPGQFVSYADAYGNLTQAIV